MIRAVTTLVALVCIALGGFGLASALAPENGAVKAAAGIVEKAATAAGAAEHVQKLVGVVPGSAIAAVGLALLLFGPSGGPSARQERAPSGEAAKPSARGLKKAEKSAAALAKDGDPTGAGELCVDAGLPDLAVKYFVEAREFAKAADVRQGQNKHDEAADLYLSAGRFENAAALYATRQQWEKAADCYRKAGKMSVAAEMYEKAGKLIAAGECYMRCEFYRHAAQAFLKQHDWSRAAKAVEKALEEELASPTIGDNKERARELKKLVLQAAKLHEEGGDIEAALKALVGGQLWGAAAELAESKGPFERAADFYQRANNVPKAAEALRRIGENGAAAQMLGEHLRDKGEDAQAAQLLVEAGDFGSAADLYRKLEDWKLAGDCYERGGDNVRAGEMYRLATEWEAAASAYEKARQFREAAECVSQLGDGRREAKLLAQGGAHFAAAQVFAREGLEEDAIKLLQQVPERSGDFREAAALLGEIFRKKGKHSLAQKKLEQAIAGEPLSAANAELYYQLASVHEAANQPRAAIELYEKILAIDFHFRDVDARLEALRVQVETQDSPSGVPGLSDSKSGEPRPARYRIDRELGRGGMGIVYQATDLVLDRPVALKVLPDGLRDNPQALRNFIREAKAAAKLNHPNIVTVYDAGEQSGRTYIAMEYVDGTTLKAVVKQRGPLAPRAIVHVLAQVCEGLHYAHSQKVIHRDIKTANLMWTREKKAKIMDFGLARVVEGVLNHSTLVSGTPYYMSPEQTEGGAVDHRSDLYSLGVTAFELATGQVPFKEGNVAYHHVHTPPPDPRSLRAEIPAALAELILACMAKSPADRPQAAQDVLNRLRAVVAS
ncbi:MAG: protein kinase [Deltaproteobacteria bacterium]|nr:protein kinase [Deltaproteobacteria bacterium]